MYTVKTYETVNNTYFVGRIIKTTYEQQQEQRREFAYMAFQKALGTIATVGSIVGIAYGLIPLVLTLVVGIALIFTKDHVVG